MAQRTISCPVCESVDFHTLLTAIGNRGVPVIANEHPVVICRGCGMCFLNPQHEQADYDVHYRDYDRQIGRKLAVSPEITTGGKRTMFDRIRLSFFEHYVPDRNAKIVDVGAGYGVFLKHLSDDGYCKLTGIEPNTEAVRMIREVFHFDVLQGSIGDDSLPADTFDVAMLIAVIEHFTDPVSALCAIKKILRPGGLFYINTPNVTDLMLNNGVNKYFKFVHTMYFSDISWLCCTIPIFSPQHYVIRYNTGI
jgi:SAM-dependent methyltransferase